MKSSVISSLRFLSLLFVSALLSATVVPAAEGAIRLEPVLSGLSSPLYVTNADDGSNRLFVVEQPGQIKVLAADRTTLNVFLDIRSKVQFGGERGLLGLAFHPQFQTNQRFFVNYTRLSDGAIVIAEYQALATATATAATERILLVIPHPTNSNHNGGMIEFGPDGYLYIGTGDGGGSNDVPNNAQTINQLLGKILRIGVDPADGLPYSLPPDNPFVGAAGADEIFAVGMRNPFRFSFDRAGTPPHQLYVGDVGQNTWEEIDIVTVGGNYGWRILEGNHCNPIADPCTPPANYVPPIAEYGHTGGRCSITGGYVYRGPAAVLPAGTYVFGDYCTGEIFSLAGGVSSVLLDTALNISSFGEDEAGEIYVVGLGGTVDRISAASSNATTTTLTGAPNPATVGASVTFTATVAGANPTGSVNFTESGSAIAGCPAGTLSGTPRTASCSTSSLAVGVHSIVANYGGDPSNAASSSTPLTQVITGPPTAATFVGTDVATQGNWHGLYGSDGYAVLGDSTSYPAYAQVTQFGQASYTWAAQPNTDPRALQRAASGRIAACWYAAGSFTVDVNLTDQGSHRVALYLLDWDTTTRATRVDVVDAATQQVLATQSVQSFSAGVYLVWNVQGHVLFRFTNVGGANAVLSGIFFDPAGATTTYAISGSVTVGGNALAGVNFSATAASCTASNAQGQYSCTVPQNWSGTVTPALAGYNFTPASRNYSGVAANQTAQNYTATINSGGSTSASFVGTDVATQGNWHGLYGSDGYAVLGDSTSYPAYAQVTQFGQASYTWAAQPNTDPRALQRAASGRIAACWYAAGSFTVDVNLTDQGSHRVALYLLDWDTTTRATRVDVVDAATQQVLATQSVQSFSAGVYLVWNVQGHVLFRFTNVGGANAVLSGIFFDPAGATTTYAISGSVTVGGNALAGVNFSATAASCTASNAQGQYSCTVPQNWSGTVTPALAGYNFTPASRNYSGVAANQTAQNYTATINSGGSTSASFVGTDVATQGNWHGLYGSDGYAVLGDSTSYPAYAQVTQFGQASYTWAAQPNTDPRALQRAASGRIAACWYAAGSFTVDVNLTDQGSHRVALYLLDWDTTTRATRVDVLDAATQQVLATQSVQSFSAGVYLVWNVQGHVLFRFTNVGGANAVLSGIFFDPAGATTTYAVSGTVTAGGNALAGVSFGAAAGGSCTASDGVGHYVCTVPQGWSGTVMPSLSGYSFTPPWGSYSNVTASQVTQDYAASAIVGGLAPWNTFARDAQHTALSTTASQPLNQIHWQTPMDLQPQYSGGGSLLIHYGSPLVTSANTVIVPVKTGTTDGFRVDARNGSDGGLKWSMTTDYVLPPHGTWTPAFGPALTSQPRLYFPGAGGTVYFRDQPDATTGASGRIAFYGTSNYLADPQAYDGVRINTPLTTDPAGNVYFGFQVTGTAPLGLTSGIARISASGEGIWTPVTTASNDPGMTKVPHNSAPALSQDLGTLYVAVSNGSAGYGYLVALNSTTLTRITQVRLKEPMSGLDARLNDFGSASPTVGTDGEVYFGVLGNPSGQNHSRGWLLHFDGNLSQSKTPGSFGWDDTVSLVPAPMVPSYQGASAYLLMVKYNDYTTGLHRIAILDPNVAQTDPVTGATVMKEVLTILGPTPDGAGVREWCINTAAVDPLTKSILANNEDGKLYRWDLTTNTLSQTVVLTVGLGEAYTSTVIGADGHVYAINNAILFAVGQ